MNNQKESYHKRNLEINLSMLYKEENYEYYVSVFEEFYKYVNTGSFDINYAKETLEKINEIMSVSSKPYLADICNYYNNLCNFLQNIEKYKNSKKEIPHIFLLAGNPGSGKSYLMRNIISKLPQFEIIKKYSTRPKRKDEKNVPEIEGGYDAEYVSALDYTYTTKMKEESNIYGIKKEDIENTLKNGKIPIIITSNEDFYLQIANDFPCQTHILEIVALDNEDIQLEIFKDQDRSDEEIKNRIGVNNTDWIEKYEYNTRSIINPIILHGLEQKRSENFSKDEIKLQLSEFGISLNLDTYKDDLINYFRINKSVQALNKHILSPYKVGNYERNPALIKTN